MKKKWLIIIGMLITIVAIFVNKNRYLEDDKTINIGAIFIMTGSGSELGKEGAESLEIAKTLMEDIYEKLGLKVRFYIEDSKSTPQGAINAYNILKLKIPKFDYVISHGSFAGGALSEVTKSDGKILLSTGSISKPIDNNPYFIVNANDESAVAEKFVEVVNKNKVFVFYQDDDFGQSVLGALKDRIGEFPSCSFSSASDSKNIVLKSMPNIANDTNVVVVGFGGMTINIIKYLRQNGFSGKIFGSPGMLTDENVAILNSYSKDLYIMQYFIPDGDILNLYKEKFGRTEPSVSDVQTLNAILLALNSYVMCCESGNYKPSRDVLMKTFFSRDNMNLAPCVLNMYNQRIYYKMEFKKIECDN